METLNRGNVLTWYKTDGTYSGLRNGGRQDQGHSCLFAFPGEVISVYLNFDTPSGSASVIAKAYSVEPVVGTLTAHTAINGDRHLYGSLTMPTRPGKYRLSFSGLPNYLSTHIYVSPDSEFVELNTHLFSFRNNYTIDDIEYPHLADEDFRQSLRILSSRVSVETQSNRQEYRRPDGVLINNNASKSVRHKLNFLNVDNSMKIGLHTMSMHDDIRVNGNQMLANNFAPIDNAIGQTGGATITFEERGLSWAQTCKFL